MGLKRIESAEEQQKFLLQFMESHKKGGKTVEVDSCRSGDDEFYADLAVASFNRSHQPSRTNRSSFSSTTSVVFTHSTEAPPPSSNDFSSHHSFKIEQRTTFNTSSNANQSINPLFAAELPLQCNTIPTCSTSNQQTVINN